MTTQAIRSTLVSELAKRAGALSADEENALNSGRKTENTRCAQS